LSPRKKLQKLTISLLKEGLDRSSALRQRDDLKSHRVHVLDQGKDALFVASHPPTPPKWIPYLDPHVSGSLEGIVTASGSAVLLIEASKRLFAVTFGQGRHLIQTDAFVQDFGLRVVLNTVDSSQLKSVDAKTIDETTVHTRRDLSRDSSFAAFGLDVSRDLLRAVTGTPKDETLAHRLTGADALGIQTYLQLPELPGLCDRLLGSYDDDAYKENFDFIDFLRPEKRADTIEKLNAQLIEDLQNQDITDVHLAAPETLDWIDIDGFRFSSAEKGDADNDPKISHYLDTVKREDLDLSRLKVDDLIAVRSSDGQPYTSWHIFNCLVYQVELDDKLYVLSTGDWFRVDLAYRDRVEAEVNALPRLDGLPEADAGTDEDAYNRMAARELDALCLDKKLVYDGGPDKMEIRDILTRDAGLIHVKQRGSSSTLSHLFAQGVNSAERLLLDQDFRDKARAVTAGEDGSFANVLPANRPDASDHEVSFVVITRSDRTTPLTLPFFSVVSLRAAASRLQAFGFKVSVAAVKESAP
jgi:uncharacterized protein (TIGR04141 family)